MTSTERRRWAAALRAHLRERGISQAAFARHLGVAPSAVHYWLRGAVPRGEMRQHVERAIAPSRARMIGFNRGSA
jgi:predicted transcriptional regulator